MTKINQALPTTETSSIVVSFIVLVLRVLWWFFTFHCSAVSASNIVVPWFHLSLAEMQHVAPSKVSMVYSSLPPPPPDLQLSSYCLLNRTQTKVKHSRMLAALPVKPLLNVLVYALPSSYRTQYILYVARLGH